MVQLIITSVRLRLFERGQGPRGALAVGSIRFDGGWQIEHVQVIEKENGSLLVVMPTRYEKGRYHDVVHPITEQARQHVNREVLLAYARVAAAFEPLTNPAPLTGTAEHVKLRP